MAFSAERLRENATLDAVGFCIRDHDGARGRHGPRHAPGHAARALPWRSPDPYLWSMIIERVVAMAFRMDSMRSVLQIADGMVLGSQMRLAQSRP